MRSQWMDSGVPYSQTHLMITLELSSATLDCVWWTVISQSWLETTRHAQVGCHGPSNGKSQFLMGKSTISMAIFNSFLYVHQRVFPEVGRLWLGSLKVTLVWSVDATWCNWEAGKVWNSKRFSFIWGYNKGSAVVNMLYHSLGHETFRKGLSEWLEKCKSLAKQGERFENPPCG